MNDRNERHGAFMMMLGGHRLLSYTDGGPSLGRSSTRRRRAAKKRLKAQRQRLIRPTYPWQL